MSWQSDSRKAIGRAAGSVRAAQISLEQLEERLCHEALGDEDLRRYVKAVGCARELADNLMSQLINYESTKN